MMSRQINKATINTVRTLLKTRTYKQVAADLAKRGHRTPRGKRPTKEFVNYIVSSYIN